MNLFSPAQIAENYVSIGKSKVNTAIPKMFLLAVMAEVFIALCGVGATTAAVGRTALLLSESFWVPASFREASPWYFSPEVSYLPETVF